MAGTKPKRLRIVTKCATEDEFIGLFCLFYDGISLYVMTPSPSETGTTRPLLLTLSDGTHLVSGRCEVASQYSDTTSPYGKAGMRVRLAEIDTGAELVERLARAAEEAENAETVKMPSLAEQEQPNELRPMLHAALTQKLSRVTDWSPPLDDPQRRRQGRISELLSAADAEGGNLDPLLDELFYCDLQEEEVEVLDTPKLHPARTTQRVRAAGTGNASPTQVVLIAAVVAAVVGVLLGYALWGN